MCVGVFAEPPADQRYTASEWVFSSPSCNLPLLLRGVYNACVTSSHTGADTMEPVPIRRLAALCDLTCAVLKGARSAQQAASAQFGRFYEPWLPKGGAGWLAGGDVRYACIALVRQCLQACRSGVPEVWLERLLTLGGHIVSRSVPAMSFTMCIRTCSAPQSYLVWYAWRSRTQSVLRKAIVQASWRARDFAFHRSAVAHDEDVGNGQQDMLYEAVLLKHPFLSSLP